MKKNIAITIFMVFLISSCSKFSIHKPNVRNLASFPPYKLDVNQGNQLKEENIIQLRNGMKKEEVKELLGVPLLQDPFHKDRWDYQYIEYDHNKIKNNKILTLFFKGDVLINFSNN